MESRKIVLKNLFTGQQWRNRHREYGHEERGGEGEMYGKSNMETYIIICKIDSQRELACASFSPVFLMMYSAYKLNKQGDNYSLDVLLSQF